MVVAVAALPGVLTGVSSQAADNVLRPIFGERNTLAIESVYFSLEDKLNLLKYMLFKQNAPSYAASAASKPVVVTKSPASKADQQMVFAQIGPAAGLPPLAGEGEWVNINQTLFPNRVILARSFIRPDPARPYAIVSLVQMDMTKLGIGAQAGTYYPGGTHGVYGPGVIPKQIQASNNLLAAFDGGFQERDGHYGMIVGNTTYVPLRVGLPALVMYKNGDVKFAEYTGTPLMTPDVLAIRQNGPYLVQNGQVVSLDSQGTDTWGRTITNSMYTWRSGLGITKQGDLIYAAGNSLLPSTLAAALKSAGAVNAIQLDINPPWVRFIIYQSQGNGQYTSSPLLSNMVGGKKYLEGYNKDFFYIYKK